MAVRRRSRTSRRRRTTRRRARRRSATPRAPKRRSSKRKVASKKRRASKRRKRTARKAKKPVVGKMWQVWNGTREKTVGGLKKSDLIMNKRGRVVSKRRSKLAQKRLGSSIGAWCAAIKTVRKEMGLKGFVPCKKGTEYYKKVVALYKA